MKVSKKCIEFVKQFEGFQAKPYYCSSNVLTVGYGATGDELIELLAGRDYCTEPEAAAHLGKLLDKDYGVSILRDLKKRGITAKQSEYDCLVSFAYNCGVKGLLDSTFYKNYCDGIRDESILRKNLKAWSNGANGYLKGLERRRHAECDMFFGRYGSNGWEHMKNNKFKNEKINILNLQKFLNKNGYTDYQDKKLIEDGISGKKTRSAFEKLRKVEI